MLKYSIEFLSQSEDSNNILNILLIMLPIELLAPFCSQVKQQADQFTQKHKTHLAKSGFEFDSVIWDYGICGHLTELVARVLLRLQFEWQCKGLFIKTLWSFWLLQLPALHLYLKPSRTQQWHRRSCYKLHGFRPDICCVLFLFA